MAQLNFNAALTKLKNRIWFSLYYGIYMKSKLKNNLVFIESRNGSDLAGNILYITKELSENPEYKHLKLCISSKPFKKREVKAMLAHYGINKIKMLRAESIIYYKYLSKSKYLVNDTSFPRRFIKKEGQIILNTWHGTPLKNMGRDVRDDVYCMGNVMRNLVFADYLVFPNEYMKEKMVSAYMLENLSKATILNEGYPRNSVFFDEQRRVSLRKELDISNKSVIVYMPTWRGNMGGADTEQVLEDTELFLSQMDKKLRDGQIMYVKYHPLMKLDFEDNKYKHIRAFPTGYEYYEVLNTADILVTDYSSVFYDFANSGRKIILYTYDKEEYFSGRGVYVSLDTFPFPQAETIDELIKEINLPKNYDDTEFRKLYCTHDNPDAVKKICQRVFLDRKVCNEEKIRNNGKENILIYGGNLDKNGITTALISLLSYIDTDRFNYYISFKEKAVRPDPSRTDIIPGEVGIIPISSEMFFDFKTEHAYNKLIKGKDTAGVKKKLSEAFDLEIRRHFYGIKFRHVIQYNGYENLVLGLFTGFDAKKSVFVHSNMVQEIELKNYPNEYILKWAYTDYDNVIVVSDDIFEPTCSISGRKDNVKVISNFHNHEQVVAKGNMPVEIQKTTDVFCTHADGINHILNSGGIKFITIGRFSPEKGHFRLIDAFETFHKTHPDSKLIIIGGTGNLYGKTIQKVRETNCWKDIIIIRSIQNPMPILKKCDLFILSSIYEGLGLVMLEADSLGIPVFSTNVHGPRTFLNQYGGCLLDDSTDGILQGMNDFAAGKIKPMNVDYKKRNDDIKRKLEEIL